MKFNLKSEKKLDHFSEMSIDELARVGAQLMIKHALQAEISLYLEEHSDLHTEAGKPLIVKNGYHKARKVTVGSGSIDVKVPRTRNRNGEGENFQSSIIPRYMKRSLKIDEAIPLMYLKGISTTGMESVLKKLFGDDIPGTSPANISRLKNQWQTEYDAWKKRDLSNKEYCYFWVDGIHFNVRNGDDRFCTLVIIGATKQGKKELIAVESGYRESSESWSTLLRDLKERGLNDPKLVIGDGALGFWKAVKDVLPEAKWQRCWVHKTANILDKMPKSVQPKAKGMIHEIYKAETKKVAKENYDKFVRTYKAKYLRAVKCLEKDKGALFTFFDFPAEHWQHIRSTNVIESTFATVRLRTKATRGHGNMDTTFMMVFKLLDEASKRWQRLRGYKNIIKLYEGVIFKDGIEVKKVA
jgi:putative transposase